MSRRQLQSLSKLGIGQPVIQTAHDAQLGRTSYHFKSATDAQESGCAKSQSASDASHRPGDCPESDATIRFMPPGDYLSGRDYTWLQQRNGGRLKLPDRPSYKSISDVKQWPPPTEPRFAPSGQPNHSYGDHSWLWIEDLTSANVLAKPCASKHTVTQIAEGDLDPLYLSCDKSAVRTTSARNRQGAESKILKAFDALIAEKMSAQEQLEVDVRRLTVQRSEFKSLSMVEVAAFREREEKTSPAYWGV